MQKNYPFEESDLPPLSGISNQGTKPVDNWIVARDLYTQRLKNELVDIVFETMLSIYKDAEDLTLDKTPENIEREFLTNLADVKVWPLNIIKGETQAIMERCPMFAELLKGVFVSNVMVLSSAQLNLPNAPSVKLRIHVPQCPEFVQTLYTNVAARFFNRPNIFRSQGLTSDQVFDNVRTAKQEIETAIDATVLQMIPLQNIIKTSINFQGNNAVIATKPPQRPNYTNGTTLSAPVRRSHRAYEYGQEPKMNPPPPPANNAPKSNISFRPSQQQQPKKEEERKVSVQQTTNKKPSVASAQVTKPKISVSVPAPKKVSVQQQTTNKKVSIGAQTSGKVSTSNLSTNKAPSVKQSRISYHSSKKQSKSSSSSSSSSEESPKKKESMSERRGNTYLRPSQFKQRTGSEANKEVLRKLNMEQTKRRSVDDYSDEDDERSGSYSSSRSRSASSSSE